MLKNPRAKITGLVLAALTGVSVMPTPAASYPVDCAILLCLAGGWPASADCARAKAVFIRRITPYPVEPPLQIWRCPMGASYSQEDESPTVRLYNVLEQGAAHSQLQTFSPPVQDGDGAQLAVSAEERETAKIIHETLTRITANFRKREFRQSDTWNVAGLSTPSGSADINISDPAFDFVRSIRVFQIEAPRRMQGSDGGNCTVHDNTRVGTYGTQGSFSWREGAMGDAPAAFGKPGSGGYCSAYRVRAMFVDWRDYEGNYGFERVDY